jgi:hypothetical protein
VTPEVVKDTNKAIKADPELRDTTTRVFHGDITMDGFANVFEEKVRGVFGW